ARVSARSQAASASRPCSSSQSAKTRRGSGSSGRPCTARTKADSSAWAEGVMPSLYADDLPEPQRFAGLAALVEAAGEQVRTFGEDADAALPTGDGDFHDLLARL